MLSHSIEIPCRNPHRLAKNDLPTIISPQNDFKCMKEAKKNLHWTQDPENAHKHKSIVCEICDWFIIGTEKIHYLSKDNISAHTQRLSLESYKRYYETLLILEVRNQYMIDDGNLKELLLSPCSRKNWNGYSTYSCCFSGMQPKMIRNKFPPKFEIVNGFVVGSMPQVLQWTTANGEK